MASVMKELTAAVRKNGVGWFRLNAWKHWEGFNSELSIFRKKSSTAGDVYPFQVSVLFLHPLETKEFIIWVKVFKNGPSKICEWQPLKIWRGMVGFKQTISLQIFKGCHSQILLGLFLNTLPHMSKKCRKETLSWNGLQNTGATNMNLIQAQQFLYYI